MTAITSGGKRTADQNHSSFRENPGKSRVIALILSLVLVLGVTAVLAVRSARPQAQGSQNQPAAAQQTQPAVDTLSNTAAPQTTGDPVAEPGQTPTQDGQFVVEREPTSVTLLAVGDDLMHITCVNSGLQADGTYNYDYMFQYMEDDLQNTDISCINQETPFVNDPSLYSNYPCFGGPTAIGDSLADVGFDLVTHATNHIWDKGEISFYDTLNLWKEHPEVTVLGIHETEEDSRQIKTINKNGIVISCLNYTYGLNGFVPSEDWMVDQLVDKDRIADDIARAKACSDILIVFAHWGTEYLFEPTQEQQDWAQFFADEGVDVVIGGHPHVLEPLEVVTGKNGNEMICYYSLGNFISHQSYNYQMLGGLATLTITKDNSGTYVSEYALEPTMTYMTFGANGYEFYGMKLRDYTDDMALYHHVPDCGTQTMWDLYYDIVGDTPEAQVEGFPSSTQDA